MKKIVFDGRFLSLSHAGLGRYSCELLKALLPLDENTQYYVLILKGAKIDSDLASAMYDRKLPVEIIEVTSRHYSLGEQTEILKILNELKPDLVHFPHFNHPLLYRGKFVVTIHDLILTQYAEGGGRLKRHAYKYVILHAAKKSQKILTVSSFVKDELVRAFDLPVNKVVVTYNGIDEKFQKITNPRTLKKAENYGLVNPYILSVGQWRSHKNLIRLVEAFAKIISDSKFTGKIDLVFAGRDDPRYPELKNKIKELGLGDKVKFTGFVSDEDLPIIYNNASVFAFPSLAEGFGLPGLEAQACGVPVASSNRTSLPEVFGKGAVYFDPENVDDMAEKILTLLTDREQRVNIAREAEINVKKFSWDRTAQKTLEVYREII